jgi:hypothetical protein
MRGFVLLFLIDEAPFQVLVIDLVKHISLLLVFCYNASRLAYYLTQCAWLSLRLLR